MVHVGVLVQSPPLARLVYSQAKKKKGRVQKTIQLLNESPTAFGLLLSYLYSHQLELPKLTGIYSFHNSARARSISIALAIKTKCHIDLIW